MWDVWTYAELMMDDIREKEHWEIGDLIRCTKCNSVMRFQGIGIANVGEGFCERSCDDVEGLIQAEKEAEQIGSWRPVTLHYWSRFRKIKVIDAESQKNISRDRKSEDL